MPTDERRRVATGSIAHFVAEHGLGASLILGIVFTWLTADWVILPAMLALWAFWRFLPLHDAPPGLQFSFSFHLFQVIAGVFYVGLTQRTLQAQLAPQYHRMMVLAVAALVAMFVGFVLGERMLRRQCPVPERLRFRATLTQLFATYLVAMLSRDVLSIFQERVPVLTQPIYALAAVQLGLLYLVLRRLFLENRLGLVGLLLVFEMGRGFTDYYSSFKEPVILAIVAAVEVLKPKKATHWAIVGSLVAAVFLSSLLWLGIRGAIREDWDTNTRPKLERLEFAAREAADWFQRDAEVKLWDLDALIDRVWDIYYTALALDRVPSVLPHENGTLLGTAFQHVLMPRFLYPDKPDLPSESEDVRRYAAQQVAGREQGTTIAFGYVIQSYIDYGVPLMFIPPLVWGIFLGAAYRWFVAQLHFEEILLAVLAVAFWANIMPYNVAWAKMLGKMLTSLIYVGGLAVVVDHVLYVQRLRHGQRDTAGAPALARVR